MRATTVNISKTSAQAFELHVAPGWDLAIAAAQGAEPTTLQGRVFWGAVLGDAIEGAGCGYLVAEAAAVAGASELVIAAPDAVEAAMIPGIRVIPVASVRDALAYLSGHLLIEPAPPALPQRSEYVCDMSDVMGLPKARRAIEIAAAGGFSLLLRGAPGVGKTMLARRAVGLLPDLTDEQARDVARVQSRAGSLRALPVRPPVRMPHHTVSAAGLFGIDERDTQRARPGELDLAHHGLLYLDELPEFTRTALDRLQSAALPWTIGAMNPCPCGYLNHRERPCVCSTSARRRYDERIAPILSRFELRVDLDEDRPDGRASESTATIRERVRRAIFLHSARRSPELLSRSAALLLSETCSNRRLAVRVGQTIADLGNTSGDPFQPITDEHVVEALRIMEFQP